MEKTAGQPIQRSTIPLNQIQIGPNPTPRHNPTSIKELADSIKNQGLLQPIAIRKNGDQYVQIFGEGRLRALKLLVEEGHLQADHPIDVVIKDVDDQEAYIIALAENDQRNEVPPLLRAESYAKLEANGMSKEEIAKRLGKRLSFVSEHLALNRLCPEGKDHLKQNNLSLERAMLLTKLDPDSQKSILQEFGPNFDPKIIRARLAKANFLTKFALFDKNLLAYQPALDPEAEYFLDREAAAALQLKALYELKDKREPQFKDSFVEVCSDRDFFEHYTPSDYGGLVLVYNTTTFQIQEIRANRKKAPPEANENLETQTNQTPQADPTPPSYGFVPKNHPKLQQAFRSPNVSTTTTQAEKAEVMGTAPTAPSHLSNPAKTNYNPGNAGQGKATNPLSQTGLAAVDQVQSKRLQQDIMSSADALEWTMRLAIAGIWGYPAVAIKVKNNLNSAGRVYPPELAQAPQSIAFMAKHRPQNQEQMLEVLAKVAGDELKQLFIHSVSSLVLKDDLNQQSFGALAKLFNSELQEEDFEQLYPYLTTEAANETLRSLKPNHKDLSKKEAISLIKISTKPQGWIPPFLAK